MPKAKIDPHLLEALSAAKTNRAAVEAVIFLRSPKKTRLAAGAEETAPLVERILKRVEKRAGKASQEVTVFKNLGSFLVVAEPDFLRVLLEQPEVAAAAANQQPPD